MRLIKIKKEIYLLDLEKKMREGHKLTEMERNHLMSLRHMMIKKVGFGYRRMESLKADDIEQNLANKQAGLACHPEFEIYFEAVKSDPFLRSYLQEEHKT